MTAKSCRPKALRRWQLSNSCFTALASKDTSTSTAVRA